MNCRKAQKLLPAMAAGELSETQAHAVRHHLEGCADCAAELRAYEESLSALRQSKDRELHSASTELKKARRFSAD